MRSTGRRSSAYRFLLISATFLLLCMSATAQWTEFITVKGEVTSLGPDGFDVAGHHVTITPDTEFISFYRTGKKESELRQDLEVGITVQVVGTKDHSVPEITAKKITVHDENGRKASGVGVIIRLSTTTSGVTLFADGRSMRVEQGTKVKLLGRLAKLDDIKPGDWIRYDGNLNDAGEVGLTAATFARAKGNEQILDPKMDQAT